MCVLDIHRNKALHYKCATLIATLLGPRFKPFVLNDVVNLKYLIKPLIKQKDDTVLWWKANANRFPGLDKGCSNIPSTTFN